MAIPFALPTSDDDSLEENYQRLEQLWFELSQVIRRILVARQAREDTSSSSPSPLLTSHRARTVVSTSNSTQRSDDSLSSVVDIGNLPNFASLISPTTVPIFPSSNIPLMVIAHRRTMDDYTAGEISCEETKPDLSENKSKDLEPEWISKDDASEMKRPCGSESLLSMLPVPISGSLWTAVIFVVGWRLLRAR